MRLNTINVVISRFDNSKKPTIYSFSRDRSGTKLAVALFKRKIVEYGAKEKDIYLHLQTGDYYGDNHSITMVDSIL